MWPLIFRSRFRVVAVEEIHDLGFVGVELHPHLFTPCLTCVYHHLEFASVSRDQTQIVSVENSTCPPDPPISIGEMHIQFGSGQPQKSQKE